MYQQLRKQMNWKTIFDFCSLSIWIFFIGSLVTLTWEPLTLGWMLLATGVAGLCIYSKKQIFSFSAKYVSVFSLTLSILFTIISFPYRVDTLSLDTGETYHGFPIGWLAISWSFWTGERYPWINPFGFLLSFLFWFFLFAVIIRSFHGSNSGSTPSSHAPCDDEKVFRRPETRGAGILSQGNRG
jgi:hypothetical protein